VDPLTQGTADAALFIDEVVVGGSARFTMLPSRLSAAERGLLWAMLREYATGRGCETGGGSNVGHGRRLLVGLAATWEPDADIHDSDAATHLTVNSMVEFRSSAAVSADYAAMLKELRTAPDEPGDDVAARPRTHGTVNDGGAQ
jgi:hypothetical protein